MRVLIVEDEARLARNIAKALRETTLYAVDIATDGEDGLHQGLSNSYDLIVLDLFLPELDGTDVCRLLRADSRVPIIMLTARATDEDKLLGLDLGADDYLTKPFNPRELVARVRAVLRRTLPDDDPNGELHFGDLAISLVRREVAAHGQPVSLTPTEFRLLETLVREPGRAFSRSELLDRAFGFDYDGIERTVDVHIMNLRRKIEPQPGTPRYIMTVPGFGYRFEGHHAA